MTVKQIRQAREQVLAAVIRRHMLEDGSDICLVDLAELFEMESLPVAAKFFSYGAFSRFVTDHPELTVESTGHCRNILHMDGRAVSFTKSRLPMIVASDDSAIPAYKCKPVGDFSYNLESGGAS